jgi:hypothetical protein
MTAALAGSGRPQDPVDPLRRLLRQLRDDVRVGPEGQADLRVPEDLHGHAGRDALLEQQGRGRVPSIVEPGVADAGQRQQRLPRLPIRAGVDGSTVDLREQQPVLLPLRTGGEALLELRRPVSAQGVAQAVGQHDRAAAGPALRLVEDQALADQALHRPLHRERPGVEVDVLPAQREGLALPEAERKCDRPASLVAQPSRGGRCGSGGMFVQSEEFVLAHGGRRDDLAIYGQEFVGTTWKLARMNLAIRGIDADLGDRSDDSFHRDQHPDLRADFVIANPPFNKDDWFSEALSDDPRWAYGTPPSGNANFAWVQHFVHHLPPTGTAGFVLANGSLSSKQSGEGKIRQRLVEADLVDCIVALPEKLFLNTGIPVCLWFLSKGRHGNGHRERRGEVLFIDARSLGRMETRTLRVLDDADVVRIAGTYHSWRSRDPEVAYADVAGFARSASAEELAEHEYVLTPGRYVGTADVADDGEPIADKIARLQAELLAEFEDGRRLEKVLRGRLAQL